MPEGPAVAGFQALRQRADAVDGADGFAERNGAVGAHQRLDLALGVEQARARQHQAALDQRENGTRGASRAVMNGASAGSGSGSTAAMRACAASA